MKDSIGNTFVIGNYVTFPDINIITGEDFKPFEHVCIKLGKIIGFEENNNGWERVKVLVFGNSKEEREFFPEEIFCIFSNGITDEKIAEYNGNTFQLN